MLLNYSTFINENLDYPTTKINIILDKMTPDLKFKIFDLTHEKKDIQLALYELSKNPTLFNEIWNEVQNRLYFMHQENINFKNLLSIEEYLNYINSLRKSKTFVFIDTETTGLGGPQLQQLTQISAIATDGNFNEQSEFDEIIEITDEFKKILNKSARPGDWTREKVLQFNHYYDNTENKNYIDEQEALKLFFNFIENISNPVLVMQNANFDIDMLEGRSNKKLDYQILDTKNILQYYIISVYKKLAETDKLYQDKLNKIGTSTRDNGLTSSSMGRWTSELNIDDSGYHDSLFDCRMTIQLLKKMIEILEENKTLDIEKYQIERYQVQK